MYGKPLSLIFRALVLLLKDSIRYGTIEEEMEERRKLIKEIEKVC